jgi:DNA-binding NtrC family response regulator
LGFTVRLASNGQEALDLLTSAGLDPDCVLLDIRMPILSARSPSQNTRLFPLTPVIMLTAYNDLATGLDAMKNGAFDYLVKPSRMEHIADVIGKAIRYREIMREKFELDRKKEEYRLSLERSIESTALELNETYRKLKTANMQTVQALAETIEAKTVHPGTCERLKTFAEACSKARPSDAKWKPWKSRPSFTTSGKSVSRADSQ